MTKPVELYRFVEGTEIFTVTSAAYTVPYDAGSGSENYRPSTLSRGNIATKTELSKANIELTLDLDDALAVRYLQTPPDFVVSLTIFDHTATETNAIWKGRFVSAKASGKQVTLNFESVFTSLRRPGLRRRYQRNCPYAVYRRGCTLDPELFKHDTTVTAMSGLTVTLSSVNSWPDGRLNGGMIKGPDNVLRFIASHVGLVITLSRRFERLEEEFAASGPGNAVSIYPGCKKTLTDCNDFFNNAVNMGGFPWLPPSSKNPFGGSAIG